jgi:hypothetical protein
MNSEWALITPQRLDSVLCSVEIQKASSDKPVRGVEGVIKERFQRADANNATTLK